MVTLGIVLAAVIVVFALYTVFAPLALNYGRFGSGLHLKCPVMHDGATVRVNAVGAALFSAYGLRRLRMRKCNLLERGQVCEAACLKGVAV